MYDSLFELADTWCPGISEEEYVEFFEQLVKRLNYPHNAPDSSAYDVL